MKQSKWVANQPFIFFLWVLSSHSIEILQVHGFTSHAGLQSALPSIPSQTNLITCRTSSRVCLASSTTAQLDENDSSNTQSFNSKITHTKADDEKIHWSKPAFIIAGPALIGAMTDPVLSLIDTAFVGQLPNSSIPLASLGACTSIFHLALNAFRASTTATTSLVSEALNKDQKDGGNNEPSLAAQDAAREVTMASIQFGLIAGFSILTVLLTYSNTILSLMGLSPTSVVPEKIQLFTQAKSYLKIRTLAAPFVLFCTVAEGAFRGYANTVIPLIASFVAAGVNLILDPILMFGGNIPIGNASGPVNGFLGKFGAGLGISGASGATALSQVCGGFVYAYMLWRRKMIPPLFPAHSSKSKSQTQTKAKRSLIWKSIFKANFTMMLKQGSLLLAWAYATSRATAIGTTHVAAHQVALSLWLIFALIQDGAAVAAQVLMSQIFHSSSSSAQTENSGSSPSKTKSSSKKSSSKFNPRQLSLVKYMLKLSLLQSFAATTILFLLGRNAPSVFTNDIAVQTHLRKLMPILALQQPLISITLVTEGLAVGGNQFGILAAGTALSTVVAMKVLSGASSIQGIWKGGIVCLFAGRLLTALVGVGVMLKKNKILCDDSKTAQM